MPTVRCARHRRHRYCRDGYPSRVIGDDDPGSQQSVPPAAFCVQLAELDDYFQSSSLAHLNTAHFQPDAARLAHERMRAIEDLELVLGILEQFCKRIPSAVHILDMMRTVLKRLSVPSQSGMRGC
jgi:hypothetical protein